MSGQRNSGHKRRGDELYQTPAWVVLDGLVGFFPVTGLVVGETACGEGKMVRALFDAHALDVLPSDIKWRGTPKNGFMRKGFQRIDFTRRGYDRPADVLITNPPYGEQGVLAEAFIERGLDFLRTLPPAERLTATAVVQKRRFVALLLSVDFDLAQSRSHLFERCPEYFGCIRLRRRIEWFKRKRDPKTKKMGAGPSKHHAWFVWKETPRPAGAEPVTLYAPSSGTLI